MKPSEKPITLAVSLKVAAGNMIVSLEKYFDGVYFSS